MNEEDGKIFNSMNDQELDKLLSGVSHLRIPASPKGKEKTWEEIIHAIDQKEEKKEKRITLSTRRVWYGIAAAVVLLIGIAGLIRQFSMIEVVVSRGGITSIILPDSSKVKINAESKVEYHRYGWMNNRLVKLDGEAYFIVSRGGSFTVDAGNDRSVIVSGTEFDVLTRGEKFEVKCIDGAVIVEAPQVNAVKVEKGKGITICSDKSPKLFEIDSSSASTWIQGEFFFQNTNLKEVFDELQRQYDISINTYGFDPQSKNYTGYFKRGNLSEALNLVCLPMELTYTVSPDSTAITIKSL